MAELRIKDGVTISDDPSFTTCERAAKGSLVEITSGGVARKMLLVWDALVGMAPF